MASQSVQSTQSIQSTTQTTLLARAFAGVSLQMLLVFVAIVLSYSLTRVINNSLVAARDGHLLRLLADLGIQLITDAMTLGSMLIIVLVAMNLGPQQGLRRMLVLIIAGVAALVAGSTVRMVWQVFTVSTANFWELSPLARLQMYMWRHIHLVVLFIVVAEFYRHESRSLQSLHDVEIELLVFEQQMAEARLKVLQAQIEPHFLFNTLANVRRLYQIDEITGKRLLDNLVRYLEMALPHMRADNSTLDREVVLIEAFLNIQQIRMGRRLSFAIEIPPAVRPFIVPPLMLLTLVENALKHGLTPLPEGGFILISASHEGGKLTLTVADSGRGFGGESSGPGIGLANIRARLAAMYGTKATLVLSNNSPRGLSAIITLPSPIGQDET